MRLRDALTTCPHPYPGRQGRGHFPQIGWRLAIRFAFQAAVGEPAEAGDSGVLGVEVSETRGVYPAEGSIQRNSAEGTTNVTGC
jgi:hypothetical protein